MSSSRPSKRPAPAAYDHLWQLLPVFGAFFAIIVFAAAADVRPIPATHAAKLEPLRTWLPEGPANATDVSVPSAADAVAKLPDVAAEAVATF